LKLISLLVLFISSFNVTSPSSQESPFVGKWEGTLSYERDGRTETKEIEELVVSDDLTVTGIYVISRQINLKGLLTGGRVNSEKIEGLMLRPDEKATANSRIDGPIEVVTIEGKETLRSKPDLKPGKGLIYRSFGHRGTSDDTDYDAVLELRRKTN